MDRILLVFLGAGLGGVGRYVLATSVETWWATQLGGFRIGTFAVNLIGSLVIGIAAGAWSDHHIVKYFVITGLLGGFTTFSSFSRDTVELVAAGKPGIALSYVLASVVMCVVAAWLGIGLGRQLAPVG